MTSLVRDIQADPAPIAPAPPAESTRRTRLWVHLRERYAALPPRVRRALPMLSVLGLYLLLAVWTDAHQWIDPYQRVSGHLESDNIQAEWFLSHAAHVLLHPSNPLFDRQLNTPDGVNMMANTSVLAIGFPLAPVTILFGPQISYLVYLTGALAASAGTAYYALHRYLVSSRVAAFLGGAFFGFAPGIIHHANGQPNFVANFLLPPIAITALRLTQPGRTVRRGILLGALVVVQVFINEELLLITAVALGLAMLVYLAIRWRQAVAALKRLALGGAVAIGVSAPLLAYPVWFQFNGPGSYNGIPGAFTDWGEDITAYFTFSRDSLAGSVGPEKTIGLSEQNTWFGAPLMILILMMVVLLWRTGRASKTATIVGTVFAVLGLGPYVRFDTVRHYRYLLPWHVLEGLPLVHNMYPSRWNYVVIACVAVLIALASDRVPKTLPAGTGRIWYLAVAIALVPLIPTPLPVKTAPNVPVFISSGHWHRYVDASHSMVPVPVPGNVFGAGGMLWSAVMLQDARMPKGYFLGPNHDGQGMFGSEGGTLAMATIEVANDGRVRPVTQQRKDAVRADLKHYRAAILVLDPHEKHYLALWSTITDLTGVMPVFTDGVWVWDVRPIVDGAGK
jgi:hypothetical protein